MLTVGFCFRVCDYAEMCRLRSMRLCSGDFCFYVSELGWARLDSDAVDLDCGRDATNEGAVLARISLLPADTILVRTIM